MELRVAGIVRESVVDGPGFRYVIFAQGCIHKCNGCHNPDTHDINGGYSVDADNIIREVVSNKYIDGVTFSGGEPFMQVEKFIYIAQAIKKVNKHIVCYTGYTFEQLINNKNKSNIKLLSLIDILIDGPYIQELKDLSLCYRGSKNQRIIDVHRSISNGSVVIENIYKSAC